MSQAQGWKWPALTERPHLGACGDLVIPESILKLLKRTGPLCNSKACVHPQCKEPRIAP